MERRIYNRTNYKNSSSIQNFRERRSTDGDIDDEEIVKFGTWDGVFVSCLLNIFGVILFMVLPWCVAQAGIWGCIIIILLSVLIVTLTTLSMSAIATSGRIEEGGAYFMISRSLGPEIGATIGILFSTGLSVAVAMYVIGFVQCLCDISGKLIFDETVNDIRLLGIIVACICMCLVIGGLDWIIKIQLALLGLLTCSIISFFLGCLVMKDKSNGILGFNMDTLAENSGPDYREASGISHNFGTVFATFFPAVTGIMAGANISGDLENPSENIPVGTLWAVGISCVTYCLAALFIGATADREVLHTDFTIMAKMSLWEPIIYAGIFAATFTSALASLVGGPRILQKFSEDHIITIFDVFAIVSEDGTPYRAYALTFVIGVGCICIGDLLFVAPLISQFFLIVYGMINLSVFQLEMNPSPSWRPSFRSYNKYTALIAFICCVAVMFASDWLSALIAWVIAAIIYQYTKMFPADVDWGRAKFSSDYVSIKDGLQSFTEATNINNYRPHFLLLGKEAEMTDITNLAESLSAYKSTIWIMNVEEGHHKLDLGFSTDAAFYSTIYLPNPNIIDAQSIILQACGVGHLRPNVFMCNYPDINDAKKVDEFVKMIFTAYDLGTAILIGRNLGAIKWDDPHHERTVDLANGYNTIDVWWIADDGGFSALIPHILEQHESWKTDVHTIRLLVPSTPLDIGEVNKLATVFKEEFRLEILVQPVSFEKEANWDYSFSETANTKWADQKKVWNLLADIMHKESRNALIVFVQLPVPDKDMESEHFIQITQEISNFTDEKPKPVIFLGTQPDRIYLTSDMN